MKQIEIDKARASSNTNNCDISVFTWLICLVFYKYRSQLQNIIHIAQGRLLYVEQTSRHVYTLISEHRKKSSQLVQQHVDCSCSTNNIELKFPDDCRTVEKLMAIEAIYISQLKPGLSKCDEW